MTSTKFDENKFYKLSKKYLDFNKSLHPITVINDPKLFGLLIEFHHVNTQTMLSIINIFGMAHTNDILSLSRTMFESVVNMGLLLSNTIPNGVDRFMDYKFCEEYKLMIHLKDANISPEFIDTVYGPETISILTENKDKYFAKFGSYGNWCGMNMLARVRILDNYYPISGKMKHFMEFLYCYVYRLGSSSTHRTSSSFCLTRELVRNESKDNHIVSIQPMKFTLLLFTLHSLYIYLLSIRFMGTKIEGKRDEIEEYYQNELKEFSLFKF